MQIVNWPRAFAFPIALRLSPAKRQRGVNLRLPPSPTPPLFYNYVLGFSDSCFFLCLSCNYIEQICESVDSFVSHCDSVLLRIVNILFVQLVAGTRPKERGAREEGGNR